MSVCTPTAMASDAQRERPISSQRTAVVRKSAPPPPYFSSYSTPMKPSPPMRGQMDLGISPACSHSSMCGATSRSTKARTACLNISCCSVKIFTGSIHSTNAGPGQAAPRRRPDARPAEEALRTGRRGCYMDRGAGLPAAHAECVVGHAGKDAAMLQERIEGKWIDAFAAVFGRCDVTAGLEVAILSETQSRPVNVALAELALAVARRPALSRRGAHAAAARGRSRPVDGRLRRASGPQAGGERARPVGRGRRLHRRGPAARARAAADPGCRRARPHDLERASRGARAARPHRRPRGQGEGRNSPAARRRNRCTSRHHRARTSTSRSTARRWAAAGVIRRGRAPSRTGPEGSASAFPRAAASPGAW